MEGNKLKWLWVLDSEDTLDAYEVEADSVSVDACDSVDTAASVKCINLRKND